MGNYYGESKARKGDGVLRHFGVFNRVIREGLTEKVFEQRLRGDKGEEHFKQEKQQLQRLEGGGKSGVQGEAGRPHREASVAGGGEDEERRLEE